MLKCGHKCQGTCGKCITGVIHYPCIFPCKNILKCGHLCPNKCNEKCKERCDNCNKCTIQ